VNQTHKNTVSAKASFLKILNLFFKRLQTRQILITILGRVIEVRPKENNWQIRLRDEPVHKQAARGHVKTEYRAVY
jgi:hypothetical protein